MQARPPRPLAAVLAPAVAAAARIQRRVASRVGTERSLAVLLAGRDDRRATGRA